MSLNHAVASGLRCNGCRYAVVRSFASISGVNLPFRNLTTPLTSKVPLGQRRTFGKTAACGFPRKSRKAYRSEFDEEDGLVEGQNGPAPSREQEPVPIAWHLHELPSTDRELSADPQSNTVEEMEVTLEDEQPLTTEVPSQQTQPVDPNLPWYLQVQRPSEELDAFHPLAHQQRIPKLPENPPPILAEILQRISVDLGLDNLNLLDLRHLDPPPALGSKLIMIVGSARSEKHLHVSADRFCRWLRSTHKMKPHAAGLLGRNELKLKLRRKARRMRLLANVGGQEMDDKNIDDGIRTGWVCVTVGRVKAAETEEVELPREGFIGFGRRTDGVNIVIQMFTEEKRQETDLEGLWERILRRAERDKASEAEQEVIREIESPALTSPILDALPETEPRSSLPRVSNSQSARQIRRLHTVGINPQSAGAGFYLFGTNPITRPDSSARQSQYVSVSSQSRNEPAFARPDDLKALQYQIKELKSMPIRTAHELLGTGFNDKSSTAFLRSFFAKIPTDLGRQIHHYEAWIDLFAYAVEIEAPGYSIVENQTFLTELAISGLTPSKHIYMTILKFKLLEVSVRYLQNLQAKNELNRCFEVLDEMSALGYDSLTPEIMTLFHKNLTVSPFKTSTVDLSSDEFLQATKLTAQLFRQRKELRRFIAIHGLEPKNPEVYLDLLRAYGSIDDWIGFWDIWNGIARLMIPRSPDHYVVALETVAESGNLEMAKQSLRLMVPDMTNERPPVECKGAVASKLYACLRVAEPQADDEDTAGIIGAEWLRMRDMCREGLDK